MELKTYIYLGHGTDIVLKKGPAMRTVPDGCTLSTIAESGMAASLSSVFNLCMISQKDPEMITNPLSHLNELNRKFSGRNYNTYSHKTRLMEGQYHLKVAGKPFVDKYCDFLFHFNIGNTTAIFRSGLYDISKVTKPLPVLTAGDIYDASSYNINIEEGITKDVILAVYYESIYPTSDDILANISKTHDIEKIIPYAVFVRAVSDVVVDDVHGIMEKMRGNHYFFLCRGYTDHLPLNVVEEIRQMSKNTSEPLEELSPVQLQRTKGVVAFKQTIQKIFLNQKLPNQTIDDYNYDGYINVICKVFDMLTPGKRKRIQFVNYVIEEINDGLERRFTIHDIEPSLLAKLREIQIEGVIKFVG